METERLVIREFREDDIQSLHPIFSDPKTMKYYPSPFTLDQTVNWIMKNQIRYKEDGVGLWALVIKNSQTVIGDCGLVKQTVDGKREVELGYHLNRNYWSKGYATEAAEACIEFGFNQLHLGKIISIIDPKNVPSIKVANNVGFTKEKETFIFNKMHDIYSKLNHGGNIVEVKRY